MQEIQRTKRKCEKSPSPRRAWIEIPSPRPQARIFPVALPAEGVDRNPPQLRSAAQPLRVALPAEGVDRNGFL